MQRSRRRVAMLALLAVVAVSVAIGVFSSGGRNVVSGGRNVIGIVRVEGPISGGSSSQGVLGSSVGADDIVAQLHEALEDPTIKAVVIRLNTPGGSAAASQEIGLEVQRLQDAGKPVVASMGDVAASGGYWIAATADHIMAAPATITGSIGVIMQVTNLEGLYEKLGIRVETIKSGPHKDIGSASRELRASERRLLQRLINDVYDQFLTVVSEGRDMERDEVADIADGRIFTGRQAREVGLVDSFGNFHGAVATAAELAGVADDYTTREMARRSPWQTLLGSLQGLAGPLDLLPARGMTLIRWELFPAPR